ncbi:MAG: hypothetical protein ACLP01_12930 [Solirubrobacteraceae bacterium]
MRRGLADRRALCAGAVVLMLALAGCGLEHGAASPGASITVTRSFGSQSVGTLLQPSVPRGETVSRMLERSFSVSTASNGSGASDGGPIVSVGGFASDSPDWSWSYYVNGIQGSGPPGRAAVHAGDHVWWDLHDDSATGSIPAVVGSFPEPFRDGIGGKRYPTILDCAQDVSSACATVAKLLTREGVPVASQALGGGSSTESLPIAIGTWSDLQGVVAAYLLQSGPASSGVYARFVGVRNPALELLDPDGHVLGTLHGSAGLIAATEQASEDQPTWLVTGTDVAGVDAAAAALTPARLHDRFALAIANGRGYPLPLMPNR